MNILIPVDGSKYSAQTVSFVAALVSSSSTLLGKKPIVELLNVQLPVPVRAARVVGKEVVQSYYQDEADKALKPSASMLKKAGFTVKASHAVGHPSDEIVRVADKRKADLIVMGSHGHGAFTNLVLGSVTTKVLASSKTPLLVVRDRKAPKNDSLTVGIAVDGSKYGREAVKYALKHRDLFGAKPRFVLLHAAPDFLGAAMPDMAGLAMPTFSADEIKSMQRKAFEAAVSSARAQCAKAGVQAEEVCLTGNAGDEIAAYAKKKLGVLIMGSHGYGALKGMLMGSVATRVAARCDTPLLLIRKA